MCDDREQLIEYLYGEAAPDERRRVEEHLGECPGCRSEVAGLRAVRDDLLAWSVPESEPVWRPLMPAPVVAPRRSMPAWALAAAASVLFAVGLAGGMVVRGGMPDAAPPPAAVATAAPSAATVTPADLARLEAALVARMTAEIDRKVEAVSTGASTPAVTAVTQVGAPAADELARRVAILEGWKDDQISLNASFNGNFGRLNNRTASLSQELEMSMLRRVGLETAPR